MIKSEIGVITASGVTAVSNAGWALYAMAHGKEWWPFATAAIAMLVLMFLMMFLSMRLIRQR